MITEALLDWFQFALTGVLGLLPDGEPLGYESFFLDLFGSLDDLNYFLPIVETFALVIGVMAVFPIFLGITLSLWVVAQLRGSSARG